MLEWNDALEGEGNVWVIGKTRSVAPVMPGCWRYFSLHGHPRSGIVQRSVTYQRSLNHTWLRIRRPHLKKKPVVWVVTRQLGTKQPASVLEVNTPVVKHIP